MKPLHIALALLVAVIWGVAFVVSKLGLENFTPPQLTALRFMVAAIRHDCHPALSNDRFHSEKPIESNGCR